MDVDVSYMTPAVVHYFSLSFAYMLYEKYIGRGQNANICGTLTLT